eukprot:3132109-Prymnesium_polylepis.1
MCLGTFSLLSFCFERAYFASWKPSFPASHTRAHQVVSRMLQVAYAQHAAFEWSVSADGAWA